jgi:putative two-component system response regulator
MRVLIVDDNEMTLGIVKLVLAKLPDSHCVACWDPKEALDQALTGSFDIILLDYIMPGMDGLTFARIVRSTAATAHVPIIMMTGCRHVELSELQSDASISKVMSKPLDLFELRQTLRDTFNHSKFSGETESEAENQPVKLRRVPKLVAMGG